MRLIAEVAAEEFEAVRASGGLTGPIEAVEVRQAGGLLVEEFGAAAIASVASQTLQRQGLPVEGGLWVRVWFGRAKGDVDGGHGG